MVPFIKVFECDATGNCVAVPKTLADVTQLKNDWNLPVRDMRMFVQGSSFTDGLPVILSRPSSRCFLVNMNHIKLICRKDICMVLNADHTDVKLFVEELKKHLRKMPSASCPSTPSEQHSVKFQLSNSSNNSNGTTTIINKKQNSSMHMFLEALGNHGLQLEFAVIEATLTTITSNFRHHLTILKPILEILLQETLRHPSRGILRRMLAFMKGLNSFDMSVCMVRSTITSLLQNEEHLAGLCLNRSSSIDVEKMELLLEAYSSDLKEIECEVSNIKEQVNDTNEFMNIHLNTIRNSFMKMSMMMEMGSFILGLGSLTAGLFGMNLPSGLENFPNAFLVTVGVTLTFVTIVAVVINVFIHRYTSLNQGAFSSESYRALANFLDYAKDMTDSGNGATDESKKEFRKVLEPVIGTRMSERKLDKMFNIVFVDEGEDSQMSDDDDNNMMVSSKLSSFFYSNLKPSASVKSGGGVNRRRSVVSPVWAAGDYGTAAAANARSASARIGISLPVVDDFDC